MGRALADQQRLESQLYAGLEYWCKKRTRRDDLEPGHTEIEGRITATVGRSNLEIPFEGTLQVGSDQSQASSEAVETPHLVAYLLDQLDERSRDNLLARLPIDFERDQELPPVSDSRRGEAAALLKLLRSQVTKTKRGSVVFAVNP